jgi:pimeloyl-ACP methyl ester carboxylesterase
VAESVRIGGLVLTEHLFEVPLDHTRPEDGRLAVFAREVAAEDGGDRPFLVFLQGGPGSAAPRPTGPRIPTWLERALADYRVLLLDQRGTGRSSPVGSLPGRSPQEQADYLQHFRADAIVRDAEWIRQELAVERWSILGQSFGGFCALTYLSSAPDGLREALFTGGLPPVGRPAEDVYRLTYERVRERNRRYYERYPGDLGRVEEIQRRLAGEDVRLPSGDRLTARRFRQLGLMLGSSTGAERLHYLVELPVDSPGFLHDVDAALHFPRNPLYAILHEACYADGCATRWAAQRMLPDEFASRPELFTGEMVYPWMFEAYGALAPLREAAELLAAHTWPALYDAGRLAANDVPAAAAIYADDMYVERTLSEETAARVRGLRPWVTDAFQHDGLRLHGERVLGSLLELVRRDEAG